MYYLNGNGGPEIFAEKLLSPLGDLASNLWDKGQGAKGSLLNIAPPTTTNGSTKPIDTTPGTVQGIVAFTMELLKAAGIGKEAAAKKVADLARGEGVKCEDGSPISTKQIISWRAEINGRRAPDQAMIAFDSLRIEHKTLLLSRNRDNCIKTARLLLHVTSMRAPRSAPKARAR
jgi:hypothetical protein